MKKLMIAITAMAMVSAANAAITCNVNMTDDSHSSYTAYFVQDSVVNDFAQCLFGNDVDGAIDLLYPNFEAFSAENGAISGTINLDESIFEWDWEMGLEGGNGNGAITLGIIAINSTETEWIDSTYTFYASCRNGDYSFEDVSCGQPFSPQWYTLPVPEPTSGLMMLLGMAGLALKRRRA